LPSVNRNGQKFKFAPSQSKKIAMAIEYMLGVDVGTSGCKAMVLGQNGAVIGNSFRGYETHHPRSMWAEQKPEDWYEAFKYAVKSVLVKTKVQGENIASIGIDGMMNSPTFLDEKGNVVRPSIIWMDQRSTPQERWLTEKIGEEKILNNVYSPPTSTSLLSKILWVKENQPKIWEKTHKVLLPKDYIRFKLVESFVTDWSDASATQLFNMNKFSWSREICEATEIDTSKLPEAIPSTKIVGRLSRKAVEDTDLTEEIPVVAGCSDAAADNLAAGVIDPKQCLIRLGTCGALFLITDKVTPDPAKRYYVLAHCIAGRWMIHSLTPCGLASEWFRDICLNRENHELMEALAKKAPLGSRGLLFHPYLMGEHTPRRGSSLRGGFLGITLRHKMEHLVRAVFEGIAFSFRECFRVFEEIEPSIKSVRVVGGGVKSPLWRSIMSDVLGVTLEAPVSEDASFGAGLLGGIGVGLFRNPKDAVDKCIKIKNITKPNAKNHEKYGKLFGVYIKTLDKLQGVVW